MKQPKENPIFSIAKPRRLAPPSPASGAIRFFFSRSMTTVDTSLPPPPPPNPSMPLPLPTPADSEEELASTPFETFDLFRGQVIGTRIEDAGELKVVGKLKCIVRVTRGDPDNEPLFVDKNKCESLAQAKEKNAIILSQLLKVRLRDYYCVMVVMMVMMMVSRRYIESNRIFRPIGVSSYTSTPCIEQKANIAGKFLLQGNIAYRPCLEYTNPILGYFRTIVSGCLLFTSVMVCLELRVESFLLLE